MTLLKPGKLQELAEEIAKTQIEILALQEVRWPGKGQINKKDYLFYYSGCSLWYEHKLVEQSVPIYMKLVQKIYYY